MEEIHFPADRKSHTAAALSRKEVVNPGARWGGAWSTLGLIGGALYLSVLPIGHVTALRSIAFVLAVIAAIALWSAPSRRLTPMFAAFGVWFLAACLSLLTTRDIAVSLEAIEKEVLRSLFVFLVFYMLTRRLVAYDIWVAATAVGFLVVSALAIGNFLAYGEWRAHYVPLLGDYATSAITVLPLLGGYIIFTRRHWATTLLAIFATAGILVAGYLTMSRAFWLVLICGIFLAVVLDAVGVGRVRKRSLVLFGAACIAGLILAAMVAAQRGAPLLSFEHRAPIYSVVTDKIPQNPLTGTGYGHETDRAWYAAALPGFTHPHNIVLSYLDQMGLFGIVALLMIFCAPAFVLAGALRAPRPEVRAAAICGLVLLACVLVKNSFDYFFVRHNLWLMFAHLGIYFGQIDRSA